MVDELAVPGAEIAEIGPEFVRRIGEEVGMRGRAPAEVERADDDVHVERKDLGDDTTTFIAKGDPIPAGLAALPRRPARPAPRKK
jgi:hypothetical protein